MTDALRMADIREEIGGHVRKIAGMNHDARHRYLQILVGPKTTSPSEIDMRALLMSRLNELKLWPPRKGRC